jgi:SAM-dependent methyltransferase
MIQKHKKPSNQTPSVFLIAALDKFCQSADLKLALDLPCGFGRHSLYLSQKNHKVVCADYDPDVFADRWSDASHKLLPILLNAKKELPFKLESFGLITIVHFYTDELFTKISGILQKGGIVIFESFGGQGCNWRELPTKRYFRESLDRDFEILYFKQKVVGPEKNRISVKLVARKKWA